MVFWCARVAWAAWYWAVRRGSICEGMGAASRCGAFGGHGMAEGGGLEVQGGEVLRVIGRRWAAKRSRRWSQLW